MVPEVPVGARKVFDIGAHGDEAASRLKASMDLVEGAAEGGFVRQMFKKIAGKDQIEGVVAERPSGGTVLQEAGYFGTDAFRGVRVQVHGKFFAGLHLIDEFAVAATEVQNSASGGNITLEPLL